MTTGGTKQRIKGGSFLIEQRTPEEIFTPEDMTDQHRLIAQTTEEFMTKEVLPRARDIEEKDLVLLRELLRKAAEIGYLVRRGASWGRVLAVIARCEVRCSSCHRRVTKMRLHIAS